MALLLSQLGGAPPAVEFVFQLLDIYDDEEWDTEEIAGFHAGHDFVLPTWAPDEFDPGEDEEEVHRAVFAVAAPPDFLLGWAFDEDTDDVDTDERADQFAGVLVAAPDFLLGWAFEELYLDWEEESEAAALNDFVGELGFVGEPDFLLGWLLADEDADLDADGEGAPVVYEAAATPVVVDDTYVGFVVNVGRLRRIR